MRDGSQESVERDGSSAAARGDRFNTSQLEGNQEERSSSKDDEELQNLEAAARGEDENERRRNIVDFLRIK